MQIPIKANIYLNCGKFAKIIYNSINPEVMGFKDRFERSDVDLKINNEEVIIQIKATDIIAFRASITSISRLIQVAETVINKINEKENEKLI